MITSGKILFHHGEQSWSSLGLQACPMGVLYVNLKILNSAFKGAPLELFSDTSVKIYGQEKWKIVFCCDNYAAPCG